MRNRCEKSAFMTEALLKFAPWHDPYDARSTLVDTLTNLRHYAAENNIDFDRAAEMALDHAQNERRLDARNAPATEADA